MFCLGLEVAEVKKEERKHLICFDLDNTLVHTDRAHFSAYTHSLRKHGIRNITQKQIKEKMGLVARRFLKELIPDLTDELLRKILHDKENEYVKTARKYARLVRGADKVIQQLHKEYEIAMVTNCNHKTINVIMRETGLKKQWFDVIIGQDDVKHPKPAPDEIFLAEKLLHIDADYMVGDTIYDIRAARKAGVKAISVLTGHHTRAMFRKEKATKVLNNIRELPKYLDSIKKKH